MFVPINDVIGQIDLTQIDLLAPGYVNLVSTNKSGRAAFMGEIVPAYDPFLGGGEFIYLQVPTTTAISQGTWVEFDFAQDASNGMIIKAKPWAGGANSGKSLAIALVSFASVTPVQYGWFQIGGNAFSEVVATGSWAAGCTVAYSTTGKPQMTPVSTKNVQNAQGATGVSAQIGSNTGSYSPTSTNGFLCTSTQAIVNINRPVVESNA